MLYVFLEKAHRASFFPRPEAQRTRVFLTRLLLVPRQAVRTLIVPGSGVETDYSKALADLQAAEQTEKESGERGARLADVQPMLDVLVVTYLENDTALPIILG